MSYYKPSDLVPPCVYIDDIEETIGLFKAGGMIDGVPIKTWNPHNTKVRSNRELLVDIKYSAYAAIMRGESKEQWSAWTHEGYPKYIQTPENKKLREQIYDEVLIPSEPSQEEVLA